MRHSPVNMCSTAPLLNTPVSRIQDSLMAGRILFSVMDLKLRCSAAGCDCGNFVAAKEKLRSCDGCSHSWITHLFEKLLRDETLSIFDVCSLALYGTHALPIRLKIVIERLLSTLQPEEIDKILRSFGWTPPDLARGYMIQDPRGGLLTRWSMLPREEEILILQQFLRFPPTRSLSFALLRDDFPGPPPPSPTPPPSTKPPKHHPHHAPQPLIIPDTSALNLSAGSGHGHAHVHTHAQHNHAESSSEDDEDTPQPPVDLSFSSKVNNHALSHGHAHTHAHGIRARHVSRSEERSEQPRYRNHDKEGNGKTVDIKSEGGQGQYSTTHGQPSQTRNPTATPPKPQSRQHWAPPTNSSSSLVNPATGKRRVQCSVCLKTFCDKGALKIHFSAVHLREMHKCTVAGCNMMFSSRRSRNRHSANPNPKLHSPHLRRRISPHDGRTCQAGLGLSAPLLGTLLTPEFTNGVKPEDLSHPMEDFSSSSSPSSLTSEKSAALPEELRKDGARKRKLSNPVRLPSVRDDSNDDFCCYDDGTEVLAADEDGDSDKNHLERLESLPIFSSNHSDSGSEADSSPNSDGDSIPIDKENPRRCLACGKVFQNHFGVKTHYQNVHLKLMHKCTVDGCNAAFPSKRSRDRHSANLNLHRKLLSTSDASNGSTDDGPQRHIFNPFLVNGSAAAAATAAALNQTPPWNPFLPFPMFPASIFPPSVPNSPPLADCRFCGKGFEAGPALRAHLETFHAAEALRCRHCSATFFSRRKLDTHSCDPHPLTSNGSGN